MAIKVEPVGYEHAGLALQGTCTFDDAIEGPRPGVLIVHTALGRGQYEDEVAHKLAELGYAGFVADLYGKDAVLTNDDEAISYARDLATTDGAFDGRMAASMQAMRDHPAVDAARTVAIGYCLGGRAVLNLARLADPALGVVSFHGGLMPHPTKPAVSPIKAKVLIIHGWQDPYDPKDHIALVADEMTELGADWQIQVYGHVGHAFTNPYKESRGEWIQFHPDAARRSWQALLTFLDEVVPTG